MKKLLSLAGIIIFASMFIFSGKVKAQASSSDVPWTDTNHVDYNRWYLGGMLGVYQFYGDIAEHTYFPGTGKKGKFNWMVGAKVGREFNQRFGARVNFNTGQMFSQKGDDWFKANEMDLQLDFTLNMTNIVAPYRYNKKWNATVYVGAGFFGYRSILYDGNDNVIGNVGYDVNGNKTTMKFTSCIDVGAMGAYRLTKGLDIFLEIGLTNTPVDDLDAKFVVLSELDNYSHVSLGLHYTWGKYDDAYKWNPKPDYVKAVENKIVDMGNNIDSLQQCCAKKNMINPCDTSTADGDGDKVPDCRDLELDSPEGSIVNFQGIAIISPDSATGEPTIAAGVAPAPRSNAPAIFFSPIYFEYDKTVIDSTGEFTLINVAIYMKQYPDARILISGNCDKHASDEYNEGLSLRRCNKAKKILTEEYGIDPSRFDIQPNGKRYLLFPKHDHANRRVDFSLVQ
jgi:outer membrane protein OmpA-like peptidoglycan-associated protein